MKKRNYFAIAVCLLTLGAQAQPVVTYSGNAPQIGDVYKVSSAMGTFEPGPAGANLNWDFSAVSPATSWDLKVISPESTPFADKFPEANMVFHGNSSPESFIYVKLSNSEMLHNGNGIDPNGTPYHIHYTNAVKLMQYPFSFSNTYTDSYSTTFTMTNGWLVVKSGTIVVTADAWGRVKTPAGTWDNTLRIKKERVFTDSLWVDGHFMSVTTKTQTDYDWYTATSHYPVLGISVTGSGSSLTYISLSDGIRDNSLLSEISIYPNPANSTINVKLPDGITDKIEIAVVNLTGQRLSQFEKRGNNQYVADIGTLIPGVYLVRIKNASGNYVATKFIKQ